MKLSELITEANALLQAHGDLEIFDKDQYAITGLYHNNDEDAVYEFPMPDEFIEIFSGR